MTEVKKVTKDFIIENYLFGDAAEFEDDTSFIENGIIDSTGVLELVTFLETSFSISISDEELIPENLDSISLIDKFISNKMVRK